MTDRQLLLLRALSETHPKGTTLNDTFQRVARKLIGYGWVECMAVPGLRVYVITDEGIAAMNACLADMEAKAVGA